MLLHLSDLHFGTEKSECVHAIQQFCWEQQPEMVVVSGDLTQRARLRQFFACRQFLDSLKTPYLVVPGNHDIPLYHVWDRFLTPFMSYQAFFSAPERELESEHFYVIGVNSVRRRYHTRGHISLTQIQQIQQKLSEAPANLLKIIVTHQPFYTPPGDPHGVKDCPVLGKMALELWSQQQLFALLHGHLHQAVVYDLNQIYQLQATHPVLDIQAGTATSWRLHNNIPNGFNVIHPNHQIEHYIYQEQQQRFVWERNWNLG